MLTTLLGFAAITAISLPAMSPVRIHPKQYSERALAGIFWPLTIPFAVYQNWVDSRAYKKEFEK